MLRLGLLASVSFLCALVTAVESDSVSAYLQGDVGQERASWGHHGEIMRAEPRMDEARTSRTEDQNEEMSDSLVDDGHDVSQNLEEAPNEKDDSDEALQTEDAEEVADEEAEEEEVQEAETQAKVTVDKSRPMIGRAQKRHDITRHVEEDMLEVGALSPSLMEINREDSKDVLSNKTEVQNASADETSGTEIKEPTVDHQITSAFLGFLLQLIVLDYLYGRHVRMRPQSRIGLFSIGCALCCQPMGCCALLFPIDENFLPCNFKRRSKPRPAEQQQQQQQPQEEEEDRSPRTTSVLKSNWKLLSVVLLAVIAVLMVYFGEIRTFNAIGFLVVGYLIIGIIASSEKDRDEGEVGEPVQVDDGAVTGAPAGNASPAQPTA